MHAHKTQKFQSQITTCIQIEHMCIVQEYDFTNASTHKPHFFFYHIDWAVFMSNLQRQCYDQEAFHISMMSLAFCAGSGNCVRQRAGSW